MKRKTHVLLALLLAFALVLSACTPKAQTEPQTQPGQEGESAQTAETQAPEAPAQQEPAQPEAPAQPESPEKTDPRAGHETENEAAYDEYMRVLQEYVVLGTLPDGSDHPYEQASDEEHADKYAIWDIDGDGLDELIIRINESIMAGMVEQVWGYDYNTGELTLEFTGFPDCWYTEAGGAGPAAMSPWSHGSGMESGDFWNYHVSIYDPKTDAYDYLASVEQQAKEKMEIMGRAGEFSDDYDADGNGILYVINYNFGESVQVLDDEDYEGWRRFYEGGEKLGYALILEWLPLSDFVHPNG